MNILVKVIFIDVKREYVLSLLLFFILLVILRTAGLLIIKEARKYSSWFCHLFGRSLLLKSVKLRDFCLLEL